jgi:phenylalanyl-tRNA synthetase alpha chain
MRTFPRDSFTNVTPAILSRIGRNLHNQRHHPLNILQTKIHRHFEHHRLFSDLDPVVTVQDNFDALLFPADHPGRSPSDTYYVDKNHVLRTHTSAHQRELLVQGHDRFLVSADVYRRDEIDSSHYPAFHQMEGLRVFDQGSVEEALRVNFPHTTSADLPTTSTNTYQHVHDQQTAQLVSRHLQHSLNSMVHSVFPQQSSTEPLQVRWVEAYFPFTAPSWEMEIYYNNKWMEVCGCGIVQHDILQRAGMSNRIGWAFGLGLERLAMVLFGIPDIRLFWSTDPRFTSQFKDGVIRPFQPYSKYPATQRDVSFWVLPTSTYHEHDVYEIVRDVASDLVEHVELVDQFQRNDQTSYCFRITYRSMDKNITNDEINAVQELVRNRLANELMVQLR